MAEALGAPRILVIEDDRVIGAVLEDELTERGYSVRVVTDGRAGLATLADWPANLILLDLMMAGMDGATFRTAQRAVPALAAIPVILLSAGRELAAAQATLDAAAVVLKPFRLDELAATVASVLTR